MAQTRKRERRPDGPALRPWHFGALLVALAVVLYAPALSGPFVLDDYDLMESFSAVRTGGLRELIGAGRPLLMATFVANHRLAGGFEPFSFHLTNALLHGLNAGLVWLLASALFTPGRFGPRVDADRGLFVYGLPLLFLASPIQTESVAYISSRSEVLAATFYLAGLVAFVRLRDRDPWRTAAAVFVCFAGAALSKQDKLTLPFAVLLMDYLLLSGRDWRGLKKSWPTYGLFGVGIVAGFFVVVRPFLFAKTAGFSLDWQEYLFTQFRVVWRYFGQTLVPLGLNVDPHILPSRSLGEHFAWLGLLALAGLLGLLVWKHRQAPLPVFGMAFFLLVLAPTTTFFPLADFAAERRLYLPAVGLYIAGLWVLTRVFEPGAAGSRWALAAVVALYGAGTLHRANVWSDEYALWRDAVAKSPEKERPWTWLGRVEYQRGRRAEAQQAWEKASTLVEPGTDKEAYLLGNLGLLAAQAKDWDRAIALYRQALEIEPRAATIWAQLAVAQIRAGQAEEGWKSFEEGGRRESRITPEYVMLRAQEHFQKGEYAEAASYFEQAVRARPEDTELRANWEAAKQAAGR